MKFLLSVRHVGGALVAAIAVVLGLTPDPTLLPAEQPADYPSTLTRVS